MVYTFDDFKHIVNSNKNRNVRIVRTKTQHICLKCGQAITRGSTCVTVNKFGNCGRYWICKSCLSEDLIHGIDL